MTVEDVANLYEELKRLRVEVWIDGGWAVDALLEEQTRPLGDLDIVVQEKDVPRLREYLESSGFRDVPRDDTRPCNFILGHGDGRTVDIHVVDFDGAGNGIYGPPENGEMYPAGSLSGMGSIAGTPVRCVTAEQLVEFHRGYDLRATDYHDVAALCDRFDIAYPDEYLDREGGS